MSFAFATTSSRLRVRRAVMACVLTFACASVAGAQRKSVALDAAKPFAGMSASVHGVRDSLVAIARAQVGTRYVRGGTSPARGFDCSGLVRYVMAALKVDLPRTASQQAAMGRAVPRDPSRLRPGDLLTFGNGKRGVSHVGIYIGNGKYIHASTSAGRVIESNLDRQTSSLIRAWRGVRRVMGAAALDSTAAKTDG